MTTKAVFASYQDDPIYMEIWDSLPPVTVSPQLKITYHTTNPYYCASELVTNKRLVSYTDTMNNTIDIWCVVNHSLFSNNNNANSSSSSNNNSNNQEDSIIQFMGVYNNFTTIGQCPFVHGINAYLIQTNDQGVINATRWISASPNNASLTIEWNLKFNQYHTANNNNNNNNSTVVGLGGGRGGLWWLLD